MAGKEKAPAVPTGASPHQHANEEELARESSVSGVQKTITDALTPDTSAALAFLQRLRPGGPWLLAAIAPEGGAPVCRDFGPNDLDGLAAWLDQHQGQRNLYYHLNPTAAGLRSKAKKGDITAVEWLHVDIDPRAGEDIGEERSRAFSLLSDNLPKGVPAPTVVVDSGGGYQALWRLDAPVHVDGDEAKAQEVERYTRQLESAFSADHCHNVDRIMRLPGTINVPNDKKRKKGRVPRLAQVVEFNDTAHPLEGFTQAPTVAGAGEGNGKPNGQTTAVAVSGDLPRLDSVDDLDKWAVPDWLKVLIVQGHDPDDPKKYPSRSEAYFACACGLVRSEVPDEVVVSVLTDPDFGISEAILEKPKPAYYATRQVERAHQLANQPDPELEELNAKHAVIGNLGGKCRVVEEVWDSFGSHRRRAFVKQSFEDFRNRYRNRKVVVGETKDGRPMEKALGTWWTDHPQRREYDRLEFSPGRELPENVLNLWQGYAVESVAGDAHEQFLSHVREVICAGNEDHYRYLLGWMARAIQYPDSPGEVAVVLRGGRGTGKSLFAKIFGRLFGTHYFPVSDPKHLVGSFNKHLRDAVLLFADEAFYAGDRKHESILKTLITEEHLVIEGKGVDAELSPNYIHLVMASNEKWVVPAGEDERRFFVLDVSDTYKQDTGYFAQLVKAMERPEAQANLLHYLQTYDLSGFEVRNVPNTVGLDEQKALGLPPVKQFVRAMLHDGMLPPTWLPGEAQGGNAGDKLLHRSRSGEYSLHPDKLAEYISRRLRTRAAVTRQEVVDTFTETLACVPRKSNKGARRIFLPPDLAAARSAWDSYSGQPVSWPPDYTDWQTYDADEPLADAEPEDLTAELYELLEVAKALPPDKLQQLVAMASQLTE